MTLDDSFKLVLRTNGLVTLQPGPNSNLRSQNGLGYYYCFENDYLSQIYASFWVTGFWENVDFEVGEVGETCLTRNQLLDRDDTPKNIL